MRNTSLTDNKILSIMIIETMTNRRGLKTSFTEMQEQIAETREIKDTHNKKHLQPKVQKLFDRSIELKTLSKIDGEKASGWAVMKGGAYDPEGGMNTPLAIVRSRSGKIEITNYGTEFIKA